MNTYEIWKLISIFLYSFYIRDTTDWVLWQILDDIISVILHFT